MKIIGLNNVMSCMTVRYASVVMSVMLSISFQALVAHDIQKTPEYKSTSEQLLSLSPEQQEALQEFKEVLCEVGSLCSSSEQSVTRALKMDMKSFQHKITMTVAKVRKLFAHKTAQGAQDLDLQDVLDILARDEQFNHEFAQRSGPGGITLAVITSLVVLGLGVTSIVYLVLFAQQALMGLQGLDFQTLLTQMLGGGE